jgi:hypothetical protein
MDIDLRMLTDNSYITLWLNYFLLILDIIIVTILIQYISPIIKKEWNTPHVNFATSFLVWMLGILILRSSAVLRITKDMTCSSHDCLGGGLIGKTLYNSGSIINCIGLIFVIRAIGIYRGTFTWMKLVLGAFAISMILFILVSSIQGLL